MVELEHNHSRKVGTKGEWKVEVEAVAIENPQIET